VAVDLLAVIESEGARVLAAYGENPDGRVPWSDRWTVRSVARHVAGSHRAVALILAERPDADFDRAAALPRVEAGDPEFPEWFAANTRRLLDQGRTVPSTEACWAPHPLLAGTAAYWTRRIAYDTLVHRWDAEAGAGTIGAAMAPEVAADAVDELVDVGLRVTRAVRQSPAGPAIRLVCTDDPHAWHLDLAVAGALTVHDRPTDAALAVSGTAEALLLWLWGRVDLDDGAVEVDGDRSVLARWAELLPTY
jgi:uncharacterized protein (TIGR03083 family)